MTIINDKQITRKRFVQLAVIAGAGVAAGCGPGREEQTGQYGGASDKITPYVNQPNGMLDGVPQYFAATCGMCPAGCGLLVRTMGGRAHKVEGIPGHPVNDGATCARGQAAIQHVYSADRLRYPVIRAGDGVSTRVAWAAALDLVAARLKAASGRSAFLVDGAMIANSPAAMASVDALAGACRSPVAAYSLLDYAPWRRASAAVHGRNQIPDYRLDRADVIVSIGGSFLETGPSPVLQNRQFGQFRQGPGRQSAPRGYFAHIGPRLSMTAAKADEWLPCRPGSEAAVLRAIDVLITGSLAADIAQESSICGLPEGSLRALVSRIRAAGSRAVFIGGDGLLGGVNSSAAFRSVEALNAAVRSECIAFGGRLSETTPPSSLIALPQLLEQMQAGKIRSLVCIGAANPVFTLPESSGFAAAMKRLAFTAAIATHADETAANANAVLPARSFLEDDVDAAPLVQPAGANLIGLRQPIVDPAFIYAPPVPGRRPELWFDTRSLRDIVDDLTARLSGQPPARRPATAEDLSRGYSTGPAPAGAAAAPPAGRTPALNSPPAASPPSRPFALLLYPHIYWLDGRHANLPFFQEIPDPMSAAVWNSWAEINMETAHKLGIRTGDIVRISSAHGSVDVPALPTPGLHPEAVAMPIGQGHVSGQAGATANRGTNGLSIADAVFDPETGALAFAATAVAIEKLRSAVSGYRTDIDTLVIVQDMPGGVEPTAIQNLIHETAREYARKEGDNASER